MRILLLTTGGTIASVETTEGLVPSLDNSILERIVKINFTDYDITIKSLFQLDSSNIQPEEWQTIAKAIAQEYPNYDGIVLTHGTDTLAYTASALSFMLRNIPIPVVLTGSQLPLMDPLTDGIDNLRFAFKMASSKRAGVFIAFNRKIILGTRAVKTKTSTFDAFESVNYPVIASVTTKGFEIRDEYIPKTQGKFELVDGISDQVFLIKLTPGFRPDTLGHLAQLQYKGVIIEAFGAGGLHFVRRNLIAELKEMVRQGIIVVVSSQCLFEKSDFSVYQVGRKTLEAGVIEARDMTTEATVTKLMWVLAQTTDSAEVARKFKTVYFGEMTI